MYSIRMVSTFILVDAAVSAHCNMHSGRLRPPYFVEFEAAGLAATIQLIFEQRGNKIEFGRLTRNPVRVEE